MTLITNSSRWMSHTKQAINQPHQTTRPHITVCRSKVAYSRNQTNPVSQIQRYKIYKKATDRLEVDATCHTKLLILHSCPLLLPLATLRLCRALALLTPRTPGCVLTTARGRVMRLRMHVVCRAGNNVDVEVDDFSVQVGVGCLAGQASAGKASQVGGLARRASLLPAQVAWSTATAGGTYT